jgi:plastocyanin
VFTFEETPQVEIGDVIFWSNQDKVAHWPGLKENATAFTANQIAPHSTSAVFAPGQTGTISYICTLHDGEEGTIVVGAAPPATTGTGE